MSQPAYSLEAWRALQARKSDPLAQQPKAETAREFPHELAPCGSPHCGGCYEVAPGVRLHPPRISPEWRAYHQRQTKNQAPKKSSR